MMDWMQIVSEALTQIVIPALAVVIGAYLVRWLRVRGIIIEEDAAQRHLRSIMEAAVRWAEQRWGQAEGEHKRSEVLRLLEAQGYDTGDEIVQAELEAAVNRLSPEWER